MRNDLSDFIGLDIDEALEGFSYEGVRREEKKKKNATEGALKTKKENENEY